MTQKPVPTLFAALALAGPVLASPVLASRAQAQSLHVQSPAPLQPGVNQASVDSFVGSQFWAFTAQPGRFRLVFSGAGPQEGFSVGGRAVAGMAFAPSSPTSHFTTRETPQGTVFEGSVTHPQKVVVEVDPARSPLVRQTTDYALTLSGDVASGPMSSGGGGGDPIVGVYASGYGGIGAVRFTPDGQVIASNGARGTWTLFDGPSHIYTVFIAGGRMTLTLVPGRGLVDTTSHNIAFQLQR